MDLPRVLIISTSSVDKAANIAREMGSELLAEEENIRYHVWPIDNKYYTAKVLLCATDLHSTNIQIQGVEAVVLHHDPKENNTKSLDDCLPLVHTLSNADIFLLACETFNGFDSRQKVMEWSQTNKFEPVEMEGPASADIMDEDEEGDDQTYGVDRLIEALHTHLWPNRVLKDAPIPRVETEADVDEVEDQLGGIRLNSGTRDHSQQLLMESVLDGLMGEENTDFAELYGRLMDMKEYASTLSSSDRRVTAEKLVTAFWKAMGGDPSEIEDLDQ